MQRWSRAPEIFAYFDTAVTNAYTEAMNGLAKVINRLGRGYSFRAVRAKMLYGTMKPSRTPRRKPDLMAPKNRRGLPVRIFQIIFSIAIAAASQYVLMYGLPAIVRMIAKGIK